MRAVVSSVQDHSYSGLEGPDVTSTSAVKELAARSDKHLLLAIGEGIGHLVTNIERLHDAAIRLADVDDHTSAAILGSIANEEAAKVLILLDAVRCPPSRAEERRRTLSWWSEHLWKGLYAKVCDRGLDHRNFGELQAFIERESAYFYLDGPTGVDWIYRNSILAEREGRMYVDFVRGITPGKGESPWWSTPSTYRHYSPADCLYLVGALAHVGATSVEGLRAVAMVWRDFEPEARTSREELRSLIDKTLLELEARDLTKISDADAGVIATLRRWPFPLWSLAQPAQDGSTLKQQRNEIERARELQLEAIRATERVRKPCIRISEAKVNELDEAYVTYVTDRSRYESKFAVRQPGGLSVIHPASPGYDEEHSVPYQTLKRLWRELSEDEQLSLVALAIFTRGEVADWAYSYNQAKWIVATNNERYQIHLGDAWLPGLRRYQAKPPRRT